MKEPEVQNIRSPKKGRVEVKKAEIQDRYETVIALLCLLCSGLITTILVLTGWIKWDAWYQLLSGCIAYCGILTIVLYDLATWKIDKKKAQDN